MATSGYGAQARSSCGYGPALSIGGGTARPASFGTPGRTNRRLPVSVHRWWDGATGILRNAGTNQPAPTGLCPSAVGRRDRHLSERRDEPTGAYRSVANGSRGPGTLGLWGAGTIILRLHCASKLPSLTPSGSGARESRAAGSLNATLLMRLNRGAWRACTAAFEE